MENKDKDKDKEHSEAGATGEGGESTTAREAHDACQASKELSHEREATLSRQIAEAVTRETAKVTAHFQAILNERMTLSLAGSLKINSGAASFQVMTPFDLTTEKAIYQRWKMWSEKARHALRAMEGDSGKNNKKLISQEDYEKLDETRRVRKYSLDKIESYFTLFENILALSQILHWLLRSCTL